MDRSLFNKYIDQYNWIGDLYVGKDGWGDKDTVIAQLKGASKEIIEHAVKRSDSAFCVGPILNLCPIYIENTPTSYANVNTRYRVAFINLEADNIWSKIDKIQEVSGKQFKLVLSAHSKDSEELVEQPWLLIVDKKENSPLKVRLVKGRLAPMFDKPETISAWEDPTEN